MHIKEEQKMPGQVAQEPVFSKVKCPRMLSSVHGLALSLVVCTFGSLLTGSWLCLGC